MLSARLCKPVLSLTFPVGRITEKFLSDAKNMSPAQEEVFHADFESKHFTDIGLSGRKRQKNTRLVRQTAPGLHSRYDSGSNED